MRTYFISSTFRDMQAERDLINRRVLPAFREKARAHGEDADVIDLRIGIDTAALETNAAMRKVLSVCTDEIERSKPFMIIFLGERYGSVVDANVNFAAAVGKSVTEFEIDYGLFGRRSSKCVICLRTLRGDFDDAAREEFFDTDATKRLDALKDRLRREHGDKIIEYTADWDGTKLGNFRTADGRDFFEALIERMESDCLADWKNYEALPWQKREAAAAWQQAEHKAASFVERAALLADVEKTFSDNKITFLTGARGSGKTSLLGKVAIDFKDAGRHVQCIFAGGAPYSDSAQKILEQMVFFAEEALKREHVAFDEADDPYTQGKLRLEELGKLIEDAAPLFFVIDAVDQLPADMHRKFLDFLPVAKNIHCLVSGADSFDFKAVARAHASAKVLTLPDLTDDEFPKILGGILHRRGRQLFRGVAQAVQQKSGRTLPLYLEMVAQRIDMMSAAQFTAAQNAQALNALAQQFVTALPNDPRAAAAFLLQEAAQTLCEKPDSVFEALKLVALSHHGLRASDLRGLVKDFNDLDFALVRKYLANFFADQQGRIIFSHDLIREGICAALDEDFIHAAHRRLAAHVKRLDAGDALRCLDGATYAQDFNDYEFLAALYAEAVDTLNPLLIYGITQALLDDDGDTCVEFLTNHLAAQGKTIADKCLKFFLNAFQYTLRGSGEEYALKLKIMHALPELSEKNVPMPDEVIGDEELTRFVVKLNRQARELNTAAQEALLGETESALRRLWKIIHWGAMHLDFKESADFCRMMRSAYGLLLEMLAMTESYEEMTELPAELIDWAKRAVQAARRAEGHETLSDRLELANAYLKAVAYGQLVKPLPAEDLLRHYEEARAIYLELLETKHTLEVLQPATINSVLLATTYLDLNRHDAAAELMAESERLAEMLLTLHADKWEALGNVAGTYYQLAYLGVKQGAPRAEEHIATMLKLYGKAYELNPTADYVPEAILVALNTIADAYREAGNEERYAHYTQAAEDFKLSRDIRAVLR